MAIGRDLSENPSYTSFYNHFHNILRLFDILPNFPYTTSETKCNY